MKKYLIGVAAGIALTVLTAMVQNYQVKKATAEVQSYENILVFTDSRPVMEYEYLGTVKITFAKSHNDSRDGLIKKAKSEFPNAEGIIITVRPGQADKADVIKFK
jgi:hypothetical protein